ncbi:MAG TPA: hypothetical protein VL595_24465 [Pseudonocardia sp.]|nr:hypothetical protein [Pseudonocardia sp.]
MSHPTSDPAPGPGSGRPGTGVPTAAREEAGRVGSTAAGAARDLAETAADQLGEVNQQVRRQAGDLLAEAREQLAEQARAGQHQAGAGLRAVASELHQMADGTEQPGPVSGIAKQAAQYVEDVSGWLERHEPAELLEEVQGFARRRPGVFLAGAVVAGAVVGRLTRAATGGRREHGSPGRDPQRASDTDAARGRAPEAREPAGRPGAAGRSGPAGESAWAAESARAAGAVPAPVGEATTVAEYVEQLEQRGELAKPTVARPRQ